MLFDSLSLLYSLLMDWFICIFFVLMIERLVNRFGGVSVLPDWLVIQQVHTILTQRGDIDLFTSLIY